MKSVMSALVPLLLLCMPCGSRATTMHWLRDTGISSDGKHIQLADGAAVRCTLVVHAGGQDVQSLPDGLILLWCGDGTLRIRPLPGDPFGLSLAGSDSLINARVEGLSNAPTFYLPRAAPADSQLFEVTRESGTAFLITASTTLSGTCETDDVEKLPSVRIGPADSLPRGGAIIAVSPLLIGDSLHVMLHGIGLSGFQSASLGFERSGLLPSVPLAVLSDTLARLTTTEGWYRASRFCVLHGAEGLTAAATLPRLAPDFSGGRVLFQVRGDAISFDRAVSGGPTTSLSKAALQTLASLGLEDPLPTMSAQALADSGYVELAHQLGMDRYFLARSPSGSDPAKIAVALEATGLVEGASSLGSRAMLFDFPNDPLWPQQWALHGVDTLFLGVVAADPAHTVGLDHLWHLQPSGPLQWVAVLDDGMIDPNYPGHDLTQSSHGGGNWTCEPTMSDFSQRHGSKMASIVGANTNNNMGLIGGGAGLVHTFAYKVLTSNSQCPYWEIDEPLFTAQALDEINVRTEPFLPLLNMSFGFWNLNVSPGHNGHRLLLGMHAAFRRGKLVLAASGNTNALIDQSFPQVWPDLAMVVGGTDWADRRWDCRTITGSSTCNQGGAWGGASFGPQVSVSAPSIGVVCMTGLGSPDPCQNYLTLDSCHPPYPAGEYAATGTSAACAIASGFAANLLAWSPSLTTEDLRAVMELSAHDLGAPGRDDEFGFGRLDGAAARALISPPNWIVHRTIGAGTSSPMVIVDSLDVSINLIRGAPGVLPGEHPCRRYRMVGTLNYADLQFGAAPLVWVRSRASVGTLAVGTFDSLAHVRAGMLATGGLHTGTEAELQTYVYRVLDSPTPTWIPAPPGAVRLDASVLGHSEVLAVSMADAREEMRIRS